MIFQRHETFFSAARHTYFDAGLRMKSKSSV